MIQNSPLSTEIVQSAMQYELWEVRTQTCLKCNTKLTECNLFSAWLSLSTHETCRSLADQSFPLITHPLWIEIQYLHKNSYAPNSTEGARAELVSGNVLKGSSVSSLLHRMSITDCCCSSKSPSKHLSWELTKLYKTKANQTLKNCFFLPKPQAQFLLLLLDLRETKFHTWSTKFTAFTV